MKEFNYCPSCGSRDIEFDNVKMFSCKACSFVYFQNVAAAAAAIMEYKDQIIMLRRNNEPAKGMLDLPGGFIDPKESAEDGLRREIREELQMELGKLIYVGSYPNDYVYEEVMYHSCDLYFYCRIDTLPTYCNTDEIEEMVLISPVEIPVGEIAFESTKAALGKINFMKIKHRLDIK